MGTNEGREPPAYLEYSAAMLSSRPFRLMNASQRGVLYSMRLECWANKMVPAEPGALATILGIDPAEVAAALPAVMPFFAYVDEEIVCPELERYRAYLETRRLKLSDGGRNSAAVKKAKGKNPRTPQSGASQSAPGDAATRSTSLQPACNQPATSLQPLSTTQSKPNQSNPPSVKGLIADPWVADYTAAQRAECTPKAYLRASRGE